MLTHSKDNPAESEKTYNLWVHDDRFSKQDVVINPDCFPGIKPGDLIEIFHPPSQSLTTTDPKSQYMKYEEKLNESEENPLVLQVGPSAVDILAKQPQLQISIANHIATVFGLQARKDIIVRKVDAESFAADYVEFTFKDQYIGRSDMWRLKMNLTGSCVHVGKKISFAGCVRMQVKEIYVGGGTTMCGYVTENTRTIFRSESAKYYIFIQMSREMWDFDEDGMLFFEKATHNFLPDLFKRWKELGTNHIASIVMFTRVFYEYSEELAKDGLLLQTSDNRWYKDYYKVVADWETRSDWNTAIVHLKKEFTHFRKDILELHMNRSTYLIGENTMAYEGNILEAINLALNAYDKHYVDRDLLRTGLSIVLITPGTGIFEVDKKLLRITTERMIDNGIGLDLVCLSKYPLYTVPIFKFFSSNGSKLPDPTRASDKKHLLADQGKPKFSDKSITESSEKLDTWDPLYYDDPNPNSQMEMYYTMPHWIDCSFYSVNDESSQRSRKFVPRCKMYNLQMMGIMEHEMAPISIEYLDDKYIVPTKTESNSEKSLDKVSYAFDKYDEDIFRSDSRKTLKLKQLLKARSLREIVSENSEVVQRNPESTALVSDTTFPRRSFEEYNYDKSHESRSIVAEPFGSLPKTMISSSFATSGMYVARRHHLRPVSHSEEKAHNLDMVSSNINLRDSNHPMVKNNDQPGISPTRLQNGNLSEALDTNIKGDDATEIRTSTVKPIMINNCQSRKNFKRSIVDSSSYQSKTDSVVGSLASGTNRHSAKQSSPGKGLTSRQTVRQSLVKPCNPTKNVIKISSHLRRWHHIFPKPVPIDCTKWISLSSPACLPLTTDFFPTADELADFYQQYTYTVSPNEEISTFSRQDDPTSNQSITERLLLDMISQRLAQGFQLVVSNSIENPQKHPEHNHVSFSPVENGNNALALSRSFNNEQDGNKFGTNKASAATPYYLSMGHHVHKLWYDNTGQNVEVKRYVRRLAYTMKPITYSCAVWSKNVDVYQPRQVTFHYPGLSQYNWNYLDHLISGYQDEMTDSLRFWRARFALVPMEAVPSNHLTNPSNENLDDEELRLAGFFKFQELLWKVRWDPNQEKSEGRHSSNRRQSSNKLDIKFTTCHISVFVSNHWYTWGEHSDSVTSATSRKGSSYVPSGERMITKEAKLSTIATAMQNPITGVRLQDRRWHFKLFEGVFVGNEFIDWLIKEFSDLDTRDDALEFGNNLMKQGLFVHVYRKHRLLDGHYFYQLGTEFAAARTTKSWGVFRNTKNTSEPNPKISEDQASVSEKKPSKVELSRSITIDLDSSKRSDRPERAILHYDVVHNPKTCYHFQLDWLDCTARLIEDLLQSWSRTADKCGLKLVEVPVQQARMDASDNPFQTPVAIKMAIPPPPLSTLQTKAGNLAHIPPLYFEIELVKYHGFVLDLEADELFPAGIEITHSYYKTPVRYSQYIHRSGVALIQVCDPGEGFLWVNNRLFTSHSNSGNQNKNYSNQLPNPDTLRLEFQRFCQDTKQLSNFWEDTIAKFSVEAVVENYGSDLQTIPDQSPLDKETD